MANAIEKVSVRTVLDVGCGIGNSTAVLQERFPDATIIGADNSDEMLEAARKKHPDLTFVKLDASNDVEQAGSNFDVVFSNACLQWLPNHTDLIPRLMHLLADGGVLAVQVP